MRGILRRIPLLLALFAGACNYQRPVPQPPPAAPPLSPPGVPAATAVATTASVAEAQVGQRPGEYWVINPSSGARLYITALLPENGAATGLPALVLVPGGSGSGADFLRPPHRTALELADAGFLVVLLDPDGRGRSQGQEDYDGFVQQDGLAAVVRFAASLPEAQPGGVGLVSLSYGITMASGALARHQDLPVRFLLDWEGPADRTDTGGCDQAGTGHLQEMASCDDEAFWAEREALSFMPRITVPYQRLQSERDHIQPDVLHALRLVNAAVQGSCPWARLNDLEPNLTFDLANPPAMLPESLDRDRAGLVIDYTRQLFALP